MLKMSNISFVPITKILHLFAGCVCHYIESLTRMFSYPGRRGWPSVATRRLAKANCHAQLHAGKIS
jgi:hypothetical protein